MITWIHYEKKYFSFTNEESVKGGVFLKSSEKSVKIRKVDSSTLVNFCPQYVKCTESGNITEFVLLEKSPHPFCVKKISKDYYMILEGENAGEVFEYEYSEDKSGSIVSVRRTLANLRAIINANCDDEERLRWVTLTYAENMTDRERLYKDFDKFNKRFKYWCKKNDVGCPEYIAVVEPQGRGAWHMHIIWIFPKKAPYIENNAVLAPIWRHGFTKIKAVHGVDNIGAYFSAYLADIPLDEFQREGGDISTYKVKYADVSDNEEEEPIKKAFVKGARLRLYPSGMNIYRCSRGVKMPTVTKMNDVEYKEKKASAGTLTFSHACSIVALADGVSSSDRGVQSSEDKVLNTISHEYYNKKRL